MRAVRDMNRRLFALCSLEVPLMISSCRCRVVVWLSRIAIGVAVFAMAWPAAAAEPVKKVLVIGIDGCRFDALKQAEAPHLDALMNAGAVAQPTRIFPAHYREADTISGPGWSNILVRRLGRQASGDGQRVHGAELRGVPPLLHATEGGEARRGDGVVLRLGADCHEDSERRRRDARRQRKTDNDYVSGDVEIAAAASKYLREADPTATVVYLGQVDEAGHKDGFHPSVARRTSRRSSESTATSANCWRRSSRGRRARTRTG